MQSELFQAEADKWLAQAGNSAAQKFTVNGVNRVSGMTI